MADITMLEHDGYAHLLVRRFDIEDGERIHQHSFGGLVHVDYNEPGASSYEEYLRAVLRLGMAHAWIEQAYRRVVFNVLAVNQDDHVKNLSFHLRRGGMWDLTPAYDVTFAKGQGWTAQHQMQLRDKTTGISEQDLLAVAKEFGIKKPRRILDQARAAIADWEIFAREAEVPAETVMAIRAELDA